MNILYLFLSTLNFIFMIIEYYIKKFSIRILNKISGRNI